MILSTPEIPADKAWSGHQLCPVKAVQHRLAIIASMRHRLNRLSVLWIAALSDSFDVISAPLSWPYQDLLIRRWRR